MGVRGEERHSGMDRPTTSGSKADRRWRWGDRVPEALAVLWVVAAAGAVMVPALGHGQSLGPYNLLSGFGFSSTFQSGRATDQIEQMIPWTQLAWTQVHHGHLPLWNPYSALGMPLAFNWQTAAFSVPALVGYLFPLHLAYTVQVLLTLLISGTGVYVLARVLRCGLLASAFAGTVFELSGAFMYWLGWPIAGVISWAGWLFAAAILLIRGAHRARDIVFLALAVAFALYAGQPDALTVLAVAFAVFLVVLFVQRAPRLGGSGPIMRGVVDLGLATVAGVGLAAPLALPGFQLTRLSTRVVAGHAFTGDNAFAFSNLQHLLFPGTNGFPVTGDTFYVGAIVVVLAVCAVGLRFREPEVVALAVAGIVMAGLTFSQPVISFAADIAGAQTVRWPRAVLLLSFALAVLAGLGMDVLVRLWRERAVLRWLGAGFVLSAAAFFTLLVRGGGHLLGIGASNRAASFIWPGIEIALGLVVVGTLALVSRHPRGRRKRLGLAHAELGRWAAASLLVCETAFLVAVGAPLWNSSASYLPVTPTVAALQHAVGTAIVGSGEIEACSVLGVKENVNVAYGIHEFEVYDPMVPRAYFLTWRASTGEMRDEAGFLQYSTFCPGVTTTAIARLYGVSYVLEPRGKPGPPGAVFDTRVGTEDLYRIPGAAQATLTPRAHGGALPAPDAQGTPVSVSHPDLATWKLETRARVPSVLRLRLTDVPGWHATIDGKPLALEQFSGVMLQARIPAGTHTVELHYLPLAFTAGIVLALCSAGALAVMLVVTTRRRTRPGPVGP